MTSYWALATSACLFLVLTVGPTGSVCSDTANEADSYIEPSELGAVLATRDVDRVVESLNQIKQMRYKGQILPYLVDLWQMRRDQHPNLPWDILSLDIVRVEIANVLLQAHRNGFIGGETEDMHAYVLGLIRSEDLSVASSAIWTLSIVDSANDVPEITNVARGSNRELFKAAVITLASMCNRAAAEALSAMEADYLSRDQREFLVATRRRYSAFNIETGRCSTGQLNE